MNARNPARTIILILAATSFAATGPALARAAAPDSAGVPVALTLGPGSELWLEGTSTMHDFESRTHDVAVSFTRDSSAHPPSDLDGFEALVRSSGIRGVEVQVPVRSLHSGKTGLDKNLWKSLKADEHPS